jgi:predicted acyl esterase
MPSVFSWLIERIMSLPAAMNRAVLIERDVPVPMDDGIDLTADIYSPPTDAAFPTVLVRSPYGRRGPFGYLFGRLFAERGYRVVVQSCRGTFGSGGVFRSGRRDLCRVRPRAFDVFVRLCDVDAKGRSTNVCDGIERVSLKRWPRSPDGTSAVRVTLWPTAQRFRTGHRIRVQVSSGAHPRFSRNLGTGEPIATATAMRIAHQAIHHDPRHLSAIVLPLHTASA